MLKNVLLFYCYECCTYCAHSCLKPKTPFKICIKLLNKMSRAYTKFLKGKWRFSIIIFCIFTKFYNAAAFFGCALRGPRFKTILNQPANPLRCRYLCRSRFPKSIYHFDFHCFQTFFTMNLVIPRCQFCLKIQWPVNDL